MDAIVCDKCGKVVLLEKHKGSNWYKETGFRRVYTDSPCESEIDLCPECAKALLGLLRGEEANYE